eukprot:m.310097 g.310097  ORF g.310097 m.310097 type:complete len:84 (-) comp15948_c0_seq9:4255-4506(-)
MSGIRWQETLGQRLVQTAVLCIPTILTARSGTLIPLVLQGLGALVIDDELKDKRLAAARHRAGHSVMTALTLDSMHSTYACSS